MPWCPNCRTEYREGFDTCADCQVALVDEPPDQPTLDFGEPVLLLTVYDKIEADMLLAMLREQKIPAFVKSPGIGGYMEIIMGIVTFQGAKIYVPQGLLEQAREIVEMLHPPEGWEEISEEDLQLAAMEEYTEEE